MAKNGFFDINISDPKMIEPLVVKMCLKEIKYIFVLRGKFNKQWFDSSEPYGLFIEMIIAFYDKYRRLPTLKDLALTISTEVSEKDRSKYYQHIKNLNNLSLDDYTEEYLDIVCLDYIKSKGASYLIISNIEKVMAPDSLAVSKELSKEITEINALNFEVDSGLDYLEEIEEHCDEFKRNEARIPTYWKNMDEIMGGGLYTSEPCLAVFVGATHVGKSLTLSNLSANWLNHNKFIVLITLEMGEHIYANRIDAHLTGFAMKNLKDNTEKILEAANKIKGKNDKSKLIIKYMSTASTNCNHIENYIKQLSLQEGRNPDVILIDYLTLVKPNNPKFIETNNSNTKYTIVSEEMRNLSYVFKCPVVSAAQLNREGSSSTDPDMNNIAEALGINRTADFVGILFWRNKDTDRNAGILYYNIEKNRLGGSYPKGQRFSVDYKASLRMTDMTSTSPLSLAQNIHTVNSSNITNNDDQQNKMPQDNDFINI